jgi:signal transduction histidine kinase
MSTKQSNLSRLIDVPATDPDDARRRRLLNLFLLFFVIFTPIMAFFQAVIGPYPNSIQGILGGDNAIYWYSCLAILALCTIVYALNRLPRVPGWVAASIFLLSIMALLVSFDTPFELANGRSSIIFVLPVLMAAFLLGPGGGLIYSLLAIIELVVLSWVSGAYQAGTEVFTPIGILIIIGCMNLVSGWNTERVVRETRRLSSQRAAILQGISEGVILFDPEGQVIVHNASASRLLDRRLDDCSIKELENAVGGRENADKMHAVWAGRTGQERIEVSGLTLTITGSEIRDISGGLIGTAIMLHDVTREAQIERAKDTILGLSSHEMRTPMAAMMGYAEIFQKALGQKQEETLRQGLAAIVRNCKRLNTTLISLHTLAELQAGRLTIEQKLIKTTELLAELEPLKQQALEKGLEFQVESSLSFDTLTADPPHLRRVIENLVGNAIKFTEEGRVGIRFYQENGSHWEIEVTDTGPGIEADRMPVLFEAFSLAGNDYKTRKIQGIGLGLTVAKQLVELMGGEISVQSQLGAGTKIIVKFPLGQNLSEAES